MNDPIALHWLDPAPAEPAGVTFGVPWPRGTLAAGEAVCIRPAGGEPLPTQTWPLAWWPDGSVKWLGMAAVVGCAHGGRLAVVKGAAPPPPTPVAVSQKGIEVYKQVDTGVMQADVGDRGVYLIQQIVRGGRTAAGGMTLVCRREERTQRRGRQVIRREECLGVVRKLTVEQSGPIRAVIKLEGVHRGSASGRECLPFVVRLVFYAGLDGIEIAHTFVYDAREQTDFIAGLGLRCHVPLLDVPENRHVRLAGEGGGVWIEPARYPYMNAPVEVRRAQLRAERVEPPADAGMLPAWDAFQLWQDSADHFVVRKRQTGPVCWVDCAHGRRAPGLAAVSDPGGGVALGATDFWQSLPAALAVDALTGTETTLTAWLWAPDSPAMDLRHYGTRDHRPVYEAVNPDPAVYSSPFGIARTSRLKLWALPAGCTNEAVAALARQVAAPPLPLCDPAYYHACRVFRPWQLPDRSTPAKAALEDELDAQVDFYRTQVEQRRWYGFWHYGDVMHTYDPQRHVWRYDIGGCAWHNAEFGADLWLWYAFIRSGRPDAFRMATAMVRHVSEVDSYHQGVWKGQGTRHNVVHWGCPCKEPRVCMAGPKRFLYYLTADERTGDLLDEVAESHLGRATNTPTDPAAWESRIGPTWASFCGNWLAAWERTGDVKWRDLILRGVEGILASPHRLLTGTPFTFDPATGAMTYAGDHPYHANRLVSVFGGAEAWMELAEFLEHPGFADAVTEYGKVHAATPEECAKFPESLTRTLSLRWSVAKLAAFAAVRERDTVLARRVWELLFEGDGFGDAGSALSLHGAFSTMPDVLRGGVVHESNLSTNHDSQWALNVIFALGQVPEVVDEWWREHGGPLWPV